MEQKGYDNGPFMKEMQGVHCGETLKYNLCSTGTWCKGAAAGQDGPQEIVRGNGKISGEKEGRQRYR